MQIRATAVLAFASALIAGAASGQVSPPNPVQSPTTISQGQTPLFRVTVVGRTTPAVNYRPRTGETRIDFLGTALLPRATGKAIVQGKKGYMDIDARFDKLEPPSRFGSEYL